MASSRSSPPEVRGRIPGSANSGTDPEFAEFGVRPRILGDAAVCVGLSGGLDSVVLLDVMAAEARASGRTLRAVHVHHGLSPNADRWADFCAGICEALGVALTVERVQVDRRSGEGLEAAARAARYAVYAARSEPFVALAHHADDQAETILLQLLRGAGLKGVAAMPELRALPGSAVRLYRPFLAIARSRLAAHARARHLTWIEDESNAALVHDRNYLRHEIAPRLEARFPAWRENTARLGRHAAQAAELLDELARIDGAEHEPESLALDRKLTAARRANALRAFLARQGRAMPSEARLAEIARQLYGARPDARVRIDHDGISLVRHRGRVILESGLAQLAPWSVAWHGERDVDLGGARGKVHFEPATGAGLGVEAIAAGSWHFGPRGGGERLRPAAGKRSRTLKNLLQEAAIPAWHREKLPLLFDGERLVWAPGIGMDADYACAPGAKGLLPAWRVAAELPLC